MSNEIVKKDENLFVANAETNEVLYACNTEEDACHFICINR